MQKDIIMIQKTKSRVSQAKSLLSSLGNIRSRSQFGGYSLSVESTIFALVSDGELYLRETCENEQMLHALQCNPMIYRKRGLEVSLRYFEVNEALWQEPQRLLLLAAQSLQGTLQEHEAKKSSNKRLKDLPNINLSIERLLWRIGIHSYRELRLQGAISTYVKLCAVNKNIGLNVLLALEGAILGTHQAVIPLASRNALITWYRAYKNEGRLTN